MANLYTMKVYPEGRGKEAYRVIEIDGNKTLDTLCETILNAFDFIHEHMYEFCMDNKMYGDNCYEYEPQDDEIPSTNIAIDKIGLVKGQNFSLHYDYGDDWMFTIHVQEIRETEKAAKPKVVKKKGFVEQYPDWDDDDDEEYWDEDE